MTVYKQTLNSDFNVQIHVLPNWFSKVFPTTTLLKNFVPTTLGAANVSKIS